MKQGDKVYVNWPTGKGGPYEIDYVNQEEYLVNVGDISWSVPFEMAEPAEPEIEEGRLVYAIRKQGLVGTLHEQSNGYHMVKIGKKIVPVRGKPSFVHRRWDEISIDEVKDFSQFCGNMLHKRYTTYDVYRKVYRLITGEKHP